MDANLFRQAMRGLAGGVATVTTWVDGRPWGMTVSACCSLSVEPPRVLVSVGRGTLTCRQACEQRAFGVDVLSTAQKAVAEHAARAGAPKFLDHWCDAPAGDRVPHVRGAVCQLDCALERAVDVGDHTLLIGAVVGASAEEPREPLLYFDRRYRALGDHL